MNIKVVTTEVTCPNCGVAPGQPCRPPRRVTFGNGAAELKKPHASRVKYVEATVSWIGPAPAACDLCHTGLKDEFVDGKTKMGPWASMCTRCHRANGVGLAGGRGQKYRFDVTTGRWWKVEG